MATINAAIVTIGAHGYNDLTTAQIISNLSDANIEFNALEPWPFQVVTQNGLVADGTVTPTDRISGFPATAGAILSVVDLTNDITLMPVRMEDAIKDQPAMVNQAQSLALGYYMMGDGFHLSNKINTAISYYIVYQAYPSVFTALSDTWSTPIQAQPAVIALAMAKCAAMVDDLQMAQYWDQLYQTRVQRVRDWLWSQQLDRPDRIVNIMDDDIQLY